MIMMIVEKKKEGEEDDVNDRKSGGGKGGEKKKKGKPTFTFPTPSGEMVISVWLRKMAAPASNDTMAFNYSIEDK
jgi:hypothetical protein